MISDGLLILLGSYACWSGGTLAVLYSDLHKRPQHAGEWGLLQWGATSFLAGVLALPLYFWTTYGTGSALMKGIALGLVVAFFTFVLRLGLSLYLHVPVV